MKKLFRVIAVFAVMASLLVGQLNYVGAQSNALAISPRKDYNLKAGESVDDTLTVTNRNNEEPLNLKLTVVDFQADNETGSPQLMRSLTERTAWSLKEFIDMPQQVTVNPGETVRIPITVRVPDGTGAGSYYSAIEYAATGANSDQQVNISASGVSLVFVKVPGQTKQQLDLVQFGAFDPDQSGVNGSFKGLWFGERPKVLAYRLENKGNVAEQPSGSIVIKNFSGETVYEIENANPKSQLALRGQVRRFDACINPENLTQTLESGTDVNSVICGDTEKFTPGRYTAEMTILYGENGNQTQEITARATFWYLPWWFVALCLVGLAIVVGVVLYAWRRIQNIRGRKTRRR